MHLERNLLNTYNREFFFRTNITEEMEYTFHAQYTFSASVTVLEIINRKSGKAAQLSHCAYVS
jgi:hypothetical protein